MSGMV